MNRKSVLRNPLLWIVAGLLALFAYNTIFDSDRGYTQAPISVANSQITTNNVKEASLEDKEQQIKLLHDLNARGESTTEALRVLQDIEDSLAALRGRRAYLRMLESNP